MSERRRRVVALAGTVAIVAIVLGAFAASWQADPVEAPVEPRFSDLYRVDRGPKARCGSFGSIENGRVTKGFSDPPHVADGIEVWGMSCAAGRTLVRRVHDECDPYGAHDCRVSGLYCVFDSPGTQTLSVGCEDLRRQASWLWTSLG
jgi:hypothetical protein